MGKPINHRTSLFEKNTRVLYGYHIESYWDTIHGEPCLSLKSISWVDPNQDIAGQVDLLSETMLDKGRSYWLVAASHSVGDSFERHSQAEVIYADIFDGLNGLSDAQALVDKLNHLILETRKKTIYTMPDDGWVSYENNHHPKKLDLSYLDGVFTRLDGVFLIEIKPEKVKRWAYQ